MPRYALFKDGKQISKSHSTKIAAIFEAFDRNALCYSRRRIFLEEGYVIKEIPEVDND